ncbi:MAG: hypothetical protein P3W94_004280, partial [Paracoccus sp. (in: a-proteobacteria)]|nr:hypothetical protein [Paracoccus sp. (in: a-proteobacteria)]
MSDPRFRPAAIHKPEDFGEVLQNIRRLVAEDEALSAARDRLAQARLQVQHEDPADFLARRYGGNAALARQLADVQGSVRDPETSVAQGTPSAQSSSSAAGQAFTPPLIGTQTAETDDPDAWPHEAMANAPEAPRPHNNLAMRLGSLFHEMQDEQPSEDLSHDPAGLFDRLVEDAADGPLQLTQRQPQAAPAAPNPEDEEEAIRDLLREIVDEQIAAGLDARLASYVDKRIQAHVIPEVAERVGSRLDLRSTTLVAELLPREVASAVDGARAEISAEVEAELSESLRAIFGADIRQAETRLRAELNDHLNSQISNLPRQMPVLLSGTLDQLAGSLPPLIRDGIDDALPSALDERLQRVSAGLREDLQHELPPILLGQLFPVLDARLVETADGLRSELLSSVQTATQLELESTLEQRLRAGLRDAAMGELREAVQTEIETDLPARIRQEIRDALPEMLTADQSHPLREMVRDHLGAEIPSMVDACIRGQLQDWIQSELSQGLKMLVRDQMQDALRSAVNDGIRAELQAMIQTELL